MEKLRWTSRRLFDFDEGQKSVYEGAVWRRNTDYDYIIGCDEAGRGPGAGPLYAAAVCFVNPKKAAFTLLKLNDSKKLNEKTREMLSSIIEENSIYSVCRVEIEQIEEMNILNASLFGMGTAAKDVIARIVAKNPLVLIDGNKPVKNFEYPQKTMIKGDSTSASVAAASVLAKVSRDRFMIELDKKYPVYNFKQNKGYLTKEHLCAIDTFGITEIHRRSFLKKFLNRQTILS